MFKRFCHLLPLMLTLCLTPSCDNPNPTPDDAKVTVDSQTDGGGDSKKGDSGTDLSSCTEMTAVKVMLLVDSSGSMTVSDAAQKRRTLVQDLVDHYKDDASISFAVMRFHSGFELLTGAAFPYFIKDPTVLAEDINRLSMADGPSDLQGALQELNTFLSVELAAVNWQDSGQLATTRYAVVLITDGSRFPVCAAGCDNDKGTSNAECTGGLCGMPPSCGGGAGVDAGGCPDASSDPVANWCDLPRDQWCDTMNIEADECAQVTGWFPYLEPTMSSCPDFNQQAQLEGLAQAIADLRSQRGLGALAVHVVHLYDPGMDANTKALFGLDPVEDGKVLKGIAEAGGGQLVDGSTGDPKLWELDLSKSVCGQ